MAWLTFYSAFHNGGTTPLFRPNTPIEPQNVIRLLEDEERGQLVRQSRVRHANYHASAEALAVLASRTARSHLAADDDEVGVIATGGPLHTAVAWDFARAVHLRGISRINPMYFPHLLQSSVACTVATECGARAFAMTIGHSHTAFHECLAAGLALIRAGFARSIIMPSVNDGGERNQILHRNANRAGTPIDVALCCVLAATPPSTDGAVIELRGCHRTATHYRSGSESKQGTGVEVFLGDRAPATENSLSGSPQAMWLSGFDAYAAAGTVTLVNAVSGLLASRYGLGTTLSLVGGGTATQWIANLHLQ